MTTLRIFTNENMTTWNDYSFDEPWSNVTRHLKNWVYSNDADPTSTPIEGTIEHPYGWEILDDTGVRKMMDNGSVITT